MMDIFLLTLILIYIIDISGFTEEIEAWLFRKYKINARKLKPLSCSQCMTWWAGIAYLLITGMFSIANVAVVAGLAMLSLPISQLLIFIREGLSHLIAKLMEKL
jgi:hypothetical protein